MASGSGELAIGPQAVYQIVTTTTIAHGSTAARQARARKLEQQSGGDSAPRTPHRRHRTCLSRLLHAPPAASPEYVPSPRPPQVTPLERKTLSVRRLLEGRATSSSQASPPALKATSTATIESILDRVAQRRLRRLAHRAS
ncbi:MAG: hypothetical protein PHZ00_08190 [Candidatus Peribacteraceae bacterium]|nr:hypothetical protein [Candidatus Peribacteraceae bacterium]